MAEDRMGWTGILWRVLAALALVLLTYNPTGYSYYHWALTEPASFSAIKGLAGALLLGAWIFYLRAAMLSLGWLGVAIVLLILGAVVWLLVEQKIVDPSRPGVVSWIVLVLLALVLGIGLSWSLVRQRLTGQVDVDEVER
jgi:hypothetical protein